MWRFGGKLRIVFFEMMIPSTLKESILLYIYTPKGRRRNEAMELRNSTAVSYLVPQESKGLEVPKHTQKHPGKKHKGMRKPAFLDLSYRKENILTYAKKKKRM